MTEIEARIARILREHLSVDITTRAEPLAARVMDDLGADSIDIVELTMALEDEFQVEIFDDEVDHLFETGRAGTVRDWCALVESKLPTAVVP